MTLRKVMAHATPADVEAGRTTEGDKAWNDWVDSEAKQGVELHQHQLGTYAARVARKWNSYARFVAVIHQYLADVIISTNGGTTLPGADPVQPHSLQHPQQSHSVTSAPPAPGPTLRDILGLAPPHCTPSVPGAAAPTAGSSAPGAWADVGAARIPNEDHTISMSTVV